MKKIKTILFWGVVVIIIILLLRACQQGYRVFFGKKNQQDTVSVRIDTVYIPVKNDTVYQPIPVVKYQYITRTRIDTLTEFEVHIEPADTAGILREYHSTYVYSDTQKIQYGNIVINDTVTRNKIVKRGFQSNLNIPVITKEVVLTQPKRTIGYFGISGLGNGNQPVYALGADFSLKLKNDKIYGIGAMFTRDNQMFYKAEFKMPIRLRKK